MGKAKFPALFEIKLRFDCPKCGKKITLIYKLKPEVKVK